jgi:hypothetical protein
VRPLRDARSAARARAAAAAAVTALAAAAAALLLVPAAGANELGPQVPDVNPAGGLYQHCEKRLGHAAQFRCYVLALLGEIEASGSPATEVPSIDRRIASGAAGPFLEAQCHMLMHEVGRRFAKRNGVTLTNLQRYIPRSNDPNCSAGFGMGLTMHLGRDLVRNPANAGRICLSQPTRFQGYTCIHGLGHAYMRAHHGELRRALRSCREMRNGHAADCGQGAYHDYWISLSGGDGTKRPARAVRSPRVLCGQADLLFVRACWYRTFLERRPAGGVTVPRDVERLCRGLKGLQRGGCVSAASLIIPGRPLEHLAVCARLKGRDPVNCVRALRVASLAGRPAQQAELFRACRTMPRQAVRECQEWLGRALAIVSNGRFAKEDCPRFAGGARDGCRAGAAQSRAPLITFA